MKKNIIITILLIAVFSIYLAGTAVSVRDKDGTGDNKMIFEIKDLPYPVKFANYQRNSNVITEVKTKLDLSWSISFSDIDEELIPTPRCILIANNSIAVQAASELIVYSSEGNLKFMEAIANSTPVVFGREAIAYFRESYALVYEDYSRKVLKVAEPIPYLDEQSFALLIKPSLEEVLGVVQFTAVQTKTTKKYYAYRFIREDLSSEWFLEYPGKVNHALLSNDGCSLIAIEGNEVKEISSQTGEIITTFNTELTYPLNVSLSPDDELMILGMEKDEGGSKRLLKVFSKEGDELWTYESIFAQINQPPACGNDGRVYLIDAMHLKCIIDGEEQWKGLLKSDEDSWLTITKSNFAVIVNGPNLLVFDSEGKKVVDIVITKGEEYFSAPPSIDTDGRVYIASSENLYCFE